MNENTKNWLGVFAAVAAGSLLSLLVFGLIHPSQSTPGLSLGGDIQQNTLPNTPTTSNFTVGTGSTLIAPTSTGRTYFAIQSSCATAMWLNFGGVTSTKEHGIMLAPSSTYEITGRNIYFGPIRAISEAGNCDLTTFGDQTPD